MIITNEEWKTVVIIALAIVFLAQTPLIMGHVLEQDDEVFMGIPVHVTDANNHLNLALQAKEGNILLTNKFTGEDVPALLFSPYHILVGKTANIIPVQLVTLYNFYGIIIAFAFFITLYWFLSYFIKQEDTRLLTFIIIATASGFGFFWKIAQQLFGKWISSPDLWVTEMTTFQSLTQPHFTLGLIGMLFTIRWAMQAIDQQSYNYAIKAGIAGFILTLVHVFDSITVAFVLVGWFIFTTIKTKKWDWSMFKQLSVVAGIIAPALLYYIIVFVFNPAYAEWNALNMTTTPSLLKVINGFGFLFVFALAYIVLEREQLLKKKFKTQAFFAVWIFANMILIYLPVTIQRRFIMGLQIPLAILTAYFIIHYITKHIRLQHKTILLTTLLVLFSLTNVYLLTIHSLELRQSEAMDYSNVKYLSQEEYNLLQYIDTHMDNDKIILAQPHLANYIPAITNNRVYLGHWAQTINYDEKKEIVDTFYRTQYLPQDIEADYAITKELQIITLR